MDLENIKNSTKDAIIQNFMENVKHARRGASHQRPKSWSKGTKSGSDKRKMREEGKRDAREMNEEADRRMHWNLIGAAHDAFAGKLSPADITSHLNNHPSAPFTSVEEITPVIQALADDHSDRFISTQDREGPNPEEAMRAWADDIMNKFHSEVEKRQKQKEQPRPVSGRSSGRRDTVRMYDPNTGIGHDIEGHDAYDARKDGFYYESIEHKLRKRLAEEMGDVFPNFDAPSYELEGDRLAKIDPSQQDGSPKPSHADVIEMLNRAHENALAHIATAFGPGGKHEKLDPYYMLGHYMERLEDMHDPIREKLM